MSTENHFANIFDSTTTFLKKKGITPEVAKGKKASAKAIAAFNQQTGIILPANFSSFYTEFANGFDYRWMQTDEVWGIFSLPALESMTEQRLDWARNVRDFLDDPHSLDKCIKPPFRQEAFTIWRRMESWVPIWDEGDGDHFCLDTATGKIVYDQHDWFDGFGSLAKTNGVIAGQSLENFTQNWSKFCFQPPKSFWWGACFGSGAIEWEKDCFNTEFYRTN